MSKYTANMGRIYEVYSVLRRVDKYKSINYIGKGPKGNTENLAETLLRDAIENGKLIDEKPKFAIDTYTKKAAAFFKRLLGLPTLIAKENSEGYQDTWS